MNTTAAIFFLVLGQANGSGVPNDASGGLTTIPAHYETLASCEAAGESFRANNVGLSFPSYSCVPAQVNVEAGSVRQQSFKHLTPTTVSFSAHGAKAAKSLPGLKCDDVCALIEAAE